MTQTVSLNEASEQLGVHYMTAYRYVRTGRLPAEKRGGQWFVDLEDLALVETGRITSATGASNRSTILPGRIEERLLAGDETGTFQILEAAMAGGADPDEAYLDLLAPALTNIGQRWHDGEITIADEHLATAAAMRVVARLGTRAATRRGRSRGTIILASVADDQHFLPTAILRDLLRHRGFEVEDLGANTPADTMAAFAGDRNDLVALGLVATTPGAEQVTAETIETIRRTPPTTPIVVGGAAFDDAEEIAKLGDCIPSKDARDALSIFDRLHEELRAG